MAGSHRHILVVAHTGRSGSLTAAVDVCKQLTEAGVTPVLPGDQWDDLHNHAPELDGRSERLGDGVEPADLELVIVLGGDGTILRAAELVRSASTPILGINLGHVGFLAEIERDDIPDAVRRGLARDYDVEERMTLSVRVKSGDEIVHEDWALNDATVEKVARERMVEVSIEVDRRPLSTFGCDGVVFSTPTGLHRLLLLGRRSRRLAQPRRPAARAAERARPVRAAARRRPGIRARGRAGAAHGCLGGPLVRRTAILRPASRRPRRRPPLRCARASRAPA